MRRLFFIILTICGYPVTAGIVIAAAIHPLAEIRSAVETFIQQQNKEKYLSGDLQYTLGRLDARLKLASCSAPLEPFLLRVHKDSEIPPLEFAAPPHLLGKSMYLLLSAYWKTW